MSTTEIREEKRVEIPYRDLSVTWKGYWKRIVFSILACGSVLFLGNLSPEGWTLLPLKIRVVLFIVLLSYLLLLPIYKAFKNKKTSLDITLVLTDSQLLIYHDDELYRTINEEDITSIHASEEVYFKLKMVEGEESEFILSTPETRNAIKNLLLNIRTVEPEPEPVPSKYYLVGKIGILVVLGLNLAFIVSKTPLVIFLTGLFILPCLYIVGFVRTAKEKQKKEADKITFSFILLLFILALIKVGATIKYVLF